jgi:hypothetical protein
MAPVPTVLPELDAPYTLSGLSTHAELRRSS